jgi:hypothetical protein
MNARASCPRGTNAALVAAAVAALLAAPLAAQARDERAATVGMRAVVEGVVIPGTELVPAPTTLKAPLALRVLRTWPHGELLRYDFEWTALEPGRYDLAKALVRKDGSALAGLPEVWVEAASVLPKDAREVSEPPPVAPQRLDGYTRLQWTLGALWAVGLLAILFVGRKRKAAPPAAAAAPTLADRLRPLCEAVARGDASSGAKAELERLLVAFWRQRLGLGDQKADAAIAAVKAHAEAGALLRAVELWLHAPAPQAPADLPALLAPYRVVPEGAASERAVAGPGPAGETR